MLGNMKYLQTLNERKIDLDKIFMKGRSNPITDASTMKEVKKLFPKAKKTSDVHGAVFYIELEKDLYAKAFSENTFKSEEPFTIEAIYRMKGNKQHFLYQESVNENVKDAAFNLDKIFGDDQESIETFQDIEDNGDWKDMVDYINNWGDEEMLQRYGIRNDAQVKKLAKYIMKESNEVNEAAPKMKKSKTERRIVLSPVLAQIHDEMMARFNERKTFVKSDKANWDWWYLGLKKACKVWLRTT